MCFVYVLKSQRDGTYYIGYTAKRVGERLLEHNQGKSKYTKGHLPYEITKYISCKTKKYAKGLEIRFKKIKSIAEVLEKMGSPEAKLRD